MFKNLRRFVGVAMSTIAFSAVVICALILIFSRLISEEHRPTLWCAISLVDLSDEACLSATLRKERESLRRANEKALAAAQDDWATREAQMQDALGAAQRAASRDAAAAAAQLADAQRMVDILAAGEMVFEELGKVSFGGTDLTLVVGSIFSDATAKTGFIRGYCWATFDKGGLDPRVLIAEKKQGEPVRAVTPDFNNLSSVTTGGGTPVIDNAEIVEARKACVWPASS